MIRPKIRAMRRAGPAVAAFAILAAAGAHSAQPAAGKPLADAEVRARAEALIAKMTPEEKAGQITQYFNFGIVPQEAKRVQDELAAGRAGSLLFVHDPAELDRLQRIAVEQTRLKIPLLFAFDVIHGLRTIMPVPIAVAASWDPKVAEDGQTVAAAEARAVRPALDVCAHGRHRTRSALGPHHRRRRRRSVSGIGDGRCAGSRLPGWIHRQSRPHHLRAEALRRLRRRARRARLRRSGPLRQRVVEYLSAALQGSHRRGRRQHHECVHGPERCAGHRQSLAADRGVAQEMGLQGFRRDRRWRGTRSA